MQHPEAAITPPLYDHEDDSVLARAAADPPAAADWGADDVFATVPRRRFRADGRVTAAPRSRRSTHTTRSHPAAPALEAASAVDPLPPVDPAPDVPPPPPPEPALTAGVELEAPRAWTEEPPAPGGRRTVVVTGRPDGPPPRPRPLGAERRRPPRTAGERLGARPDRVAGWAFAMGLVLIAVAAASG